MIRRHNTPAADEFRATLLVTALSYAFQSDLRAEFRELRFPVSDAIYDQLMSLATPGAPRLTITLNSQLSTINVSWPAPSDGWVLECTNSLPSVALASWPQVPPPYQTNAGTISVTFTNTPAAGNQFFRLHKP